MAEGMTDLDVMVQERKNTGTAWSNNKEFEKDGYLIVKDLWDAEEPVSYTHLTLPPTPYV